MFKFVVTVRIGYTICRAQFEMKMWVGLPNLPNKSRGHLVKFDFISALLRYPWQKLYVFRVFALMFYCTHTLWNITTVKLINIAITSFGYHFLCVVRTLMIYPLSKFQVHSTVCKSELPGGLEKKKNQCLYIIGLGYGRVFYKTSLEFPSWLSG